MCQKWFLLLLVACCPSPSNAGIIDTVTGWFNGGGDGQPTPGSPPPEEDGVRNIHTYSPMTANTAYVLRYALAPGAGNFSDKVVDFAAGEAQLFSPVDGDLVIVFSAGDGLNTSSVMKEIPFLRPFVYTAAGPASLVDAYSQLLSVKGAASGDGPLADAVDEVTGGDAQQLRLVTCTGADAGGMQLAVLCGPWAALRYPRANVDVVTFGAAAWPSALNAPFAWAWQQLVTLHYLWPFELSAVQPNTSIDDAVLAMAAAVNPLITPDAVAQSIRVPNLPEFVPEQYADWAPEDPLAGLAPDSTLPPEYQLPEGDECPVILCKTREALSLSCLGFGKGVASGEDVLVDLPHITLTDPNTSGDAVVAWNESDATLYLLFKYTEERQDWLINAQVFQSEDFTTLIQPFTQATEGDRLSELVPNVEVHSGFLKQFQSLALNPVEGGGESCMDLVPNTELLRAVCNLTQGAEPLRIVSSGFSLGGALSELAGVWASQMWPTADILVANQGAPIVGDENFVILAQATFGRAYKYVYRLDEVPSIPPLPDYMQTHSGIWIMNGSVILQDRPDLDIFETNWNDHTCDTYIIPETQEEIIGYVPQVFNATRVSVPAWVYTAQPAKQ
ncbi:hypothetical protein D9Q98_006591 [Chlorella vulgaris]|uniref:Fungal lipase-type domain-containing protein n=1 Tax=Chlorella vulgaris TaxID=3077 RepID=A0A9D4TKI3_CHLVU|nr:hypothetical protein D9Q98_006591 [Chlorella vulgaris]